MAPIVHWMKDVLHARVSVYIPKETVFANHPTRTSTTAIPFDIHSAAPMEHIGSKSEPTTPDQKNGDTASLTPSRPSVLNRYQLWPRMKKHRRQGSDDVVRDIVRAPQGRSPSSLSDTSVPAPILPAVNYRGSSLSRRRKISVPELRRKPAPENMAQPLVDSPTIPGRPALRSVSSDLAQHERSSSCPDEPWKRRPLEMETLERKSLDHRPSPPKSSWPLPAADWMSYNPTRPLSPIFSPIESTTPITGVNPESTPETFDIPPQVPPKSECPSTPTIPPRKESLKSSQLPVETPPPHISQAALSRPRTPSAHSDKSSPIRRTMTSSPKLSISIPSSIPEDMCSLLDRGRPMVRQKSHHESAIVDYAALPTGLRPIEAAFMLPENEKELLRKQASNQAERYEILGSRHVNSMSRELRNLDERCEYLRKTYKSLRAGRKKLQDRLLSYLKSESLVFSKDRLLKQQEALVELDRAIDDWANKLEHAENRRLRVRQKLLEHVAASMMLNIANVQPAYSLETPPTSGKHPEPTEPLRVDRKDIESIKIYADTQVLNLFTDIEQAIAGMCEPAC
ncbi:hypothetical protein BT63DRAFT_280693 [Microthyrium microscopicum]|uniref:Up-regulated during septation protein 1 domain-containing protein n=1 Tax=Microthyrium microscopicum TaxID=703497 RepID=A0A6A6U8J2_9PEZI|nr:hypothetical protein BT63DRAFT_280693 [Microthyrium microscopicum]